MSSSSCVASDAPSSRLSPKISYCTDRLLLQRSSKGRENVTALGAFLSRAHAALVRVAHGRIKRRTINRLSHTERRHKPSPTDTKHCPLAQGKLALIRGPRNESIPFDNGSRPQASKTDPERPVAHHDVELVWWNVYSRLPDCAERHH